MFLGESSLLSRRTSFFTYVSILIPILLFYSLFSHFLHNIPYIDDFFWYFKFIDNFDNSPTFSDKLTVFLEPYNSHRHYVQRLFILLSVYLFGEINIAFFIVVGNLFFLLLFYNIANYIGRVSVEFVFLVWLFFQPISFMNYYTFAFFNLPVLFFVWLYIRLMVQKSNLPWIIVVGFLATFSNGNGIVVWVLGMFIAFTQKKYKQLFTFGFILIGLGSLFIIQGSHSEMGQTGHDYTISFFLDIILYFVQLHASFVNWSAYHLSWLAIVIGLAILVLFGNLLLKSIINYQSINQPVLFYYLLFLSLSMALISLGRASTDGFIAIVIDHYRLYACLFLGCIVYYYLNNVILSTTIQITLLILAIFITGINYSLYLPRMYAYFNQQVADALNFNANRKWLFYPLIQGEKEYNFANTVSNSIVNKKLYTPFSPDIRREEVALVGQRDLRQSAVTLRLANASYFPLTEEAFFIVNCQNTSFYFPAAFERSWKDLLKLRLRQTVATTIIDWNTVREPCNDSLYTTQLAVLNGKKLLSTPIIFGTQSVKK